MSAIQDPVSLWPWREEWVQEFQAEKQCIVETMQANKHNAQVYHVGSTSVDGMVFKPIIDILVCPDSSIPLQDIADDVLAIISHKDMIPRRQ